ncbi:alpha/beta hydrolase [Streptomyces sp. NBC_00158]|uniref:alpha/beta hydrolase n=1 Tax=Streptomyces sp. NBC_00158 TaxID=2903627 RepID=UPI002F915F8B
MDRTPVVFIHGAWLRASSWESWAERFAMRGFRALAPAWPGEGPGTGPPVAAPDVLGGVGLDALTDHYAAVARSLGSSPVLIGHSVGALVAQHLVGAEVGRAAVAIAPAPVGGVALPAGAAGTWRPPDPAATGPLVSLTAHRFRRVLANTVEAAESDRLFARHAMPSPRRLLADLAAPAPGVLPDTGNAARGPLLLVSGQEDRLVPDSVTRAAYKRYGDCTAVTDLKQFADRGHCLVLDGGWRSVADYVLTWLDGHGIGGARPARALR